MVTKLEMILTNCAWLALDGAIVDKRSKLRMFWIIDASCREQAMEKGSKRTCVCVCVCGSLFAIRIAYILALRWYFTINFNLKRSFAFDIHMHTINFSLAAHFYLPIKIIPRQCCLYAAASVTTPWLLHLLLPLYNLLSALANCSAFKYKLFAFFPSAAGRAALRGVYTWGEGREGAKPIAQQCVAFKLHIELWHFDSTPPAQPSGTEVSNHSDWS